MLPNIYMVCGNLQILSNPLGLNIESSENLAGQYFREFQAKRETNQLIQTSSGNISSQVI
jgi:hypothetical protein